MNMDIKEVLIKAYLEGQESGSGRPPKPGDREVAEEMVQEYLDEIREEKIREMIPELQWDDLGDFVIAQTDLHFNYFIEVWEYGRLLAKVKLNGNELGEIYLTGKRNKEEAKEFCQKDYEDRILRAFDID